MRIRLLAIGRDRSGLYAPAVEEYARFDAENTNPGVVIHEGDIPGDVRAFALRVVRDVVDIPEALLLAKRHGMRVHRFKNGRGVIELIDEIIHEDLKRRIDRLKRHEILLGHRESGDVQPSDHI